MTWMCSYQEAKGISPPWLTRLYRLKQWDKFKIYQDNKKVIIKNIKICIIKKQKMK